MSVEFAGPLFWDHCQFASSKCVLTCLQVDVEASEADVVVTGVDEAVAVAVVTSSPSKGLTLALLLAAKLHLTRYIAQALPDRSHGYVS